ncbi:MAG TPA: hypothetical protein VGV63_07240 [Acidimicrobiales bacterium]|nr:hypothetical protein [Acidimicrobiales bacterium]
MASRDVERNYSVTQVAGERTCVPKSASISVEHERDDDEEEVEFQLKWQLAEVDDQDETDGRRDGGRTRRSRVGYITRIIGGGLQELHRPKNQGPMFGLYVTATTPTHAPLPSAAGLLLVRRSERYLRRRGPQVVQLFADVGQWCLFVLGARSCCSPCSTSHGP